MAAAGCDAVVDGGAIDVAVDGHAGAALSVASDAPFVAANGGTPDVIVRVKDGEEADGPQLLPGGQHVLFTLATGATSVVLGLASL